MGHLESRDGLLDTDSGVDSSHGEDSLRTPYAVQERQAAKELCEQISQVVTERAHLLVPDSFLAKLVPPTQSPATSAAVEAIENGLAGEVKKAILKLASQAVGGEEQALALLTPDILQRVTKGIGSEVSEKLQKVLRADREAGTLALMGENIRNLFENVRSHGTQKFFADWAAELSAYRATMAHALHHTIVALHDRHMTALELFTAVVDYRLKGSNEPFQAAKVAGLDQWFRDND